MCAALTLRDEHTLYDRQYAHRFVMACRGAVVSVVREGDHEANDVFLLLTNLTDNVRDWLSDCDPEYIRMDVSEEECLERLEHDETRPDKPVWRQKIREWFEKNEKERGAIMATPIEKRKLKDGAQIRALSLLTKAPTTKRIDCENYVEGYAARYEPYVLYYDGDTPIYERFERGCFDNCDMGDIIYQYDHAGRVFARTSNGSLLVEPNQEGLFVAADLGRTQAARDHYADIHAGMVTKMSWRFRLGDYYFDPATNTIVHRTVAKIYDVSGVSIPANDNTEINARSWADGVIGAAARSEAELDERRRRLRLGIKMKLR